LGNPVYPPARRELAAHGLDCSGKYAVQLKKSDYDNWDLFVLMDDNNVRNMLRTIGNDPQNKMHKLLDYTSRGGNVADPWYYGHFDKTYDDIFKGCTALLEELESE
jgi:protein-tyrosine phosphatase